MKKYLVLPFLATAFIALILVFRPGSPTTADSPTAKPAQEVIKGDGPGNPGYWEYFKMLKQDRNGNIPKGIGMKIWKQDAARKTHASNLVNIQESGPSNVGGRTRSIVIDKNNSNTFWGAGISGGVWKSTNRGFSWAPVNDLAPTLSVTSIAQDPINPNNMYFATGEPTGNSAGISGDGIFKSTDNGATWNQLPATANNNDFDYIWKIAHSRTQSGVFYVATEGDGLFKTTDGGNTFTNVFDLISFTDVTDVEVLTNGTVYIGVNGMGVYMSTTGNNGTFNTLAGGLPASSTYQRVALAVCDSMQTTLYVGLEENGTYYSGLEDIYRSTNGGTNWTKTATNPDKDYNVSFSFPWYAFMFEVKPDDPNWLITGSVGAAYSTNAGQTWTDIGYSHADYHVAAFDPSNVNNMYIGNDGGIYQYNASNMNSVTDLNSTYNVTQFYTGAFFPTGESTLGGTQDNGTWRMTGGSSIFDDVFGGDGAYCAVNQQDPNTSYVSYQRGNIRKSTNSLASFPFYTNVENDLDGDNNGDIDDGSYFINPFDINLLDGNQLYFSTEKRLWRTTNGANSWVPVTSDLSLSGASPFSIGISNDVNPTVYSGGTGGSLYRIDNAQTALAGQEVNLTTTVPTSLAFNVLHCITVHPNDAGTIFVGTSSYGSTPRVYKATNANTNNPTWTPISGDLPSNLPVNWIEVHPQMPDSFFIAATDYGLYTTTDGGSHWEKETSIPNVMIPMIRVRESDNRLFIFTHGRGQWAADLPTIVSNEQPEPADLSLTLYPNPVVDQVRIKGALNTATDYQVFNLNGQVLQTGTFAAGENHELDAASLPAGTYYLRLNAEGVQETLRFVKQ